jgi:hypothetical protein
MERLNILKLVLIFVLLVIAQALVTYFILGALNAYYGTPLVFGWLFRSVVFSPIFFYFSIKIIFNIFLAFIVIRIARKENENRFVWFIFTAIFGLSAFAILYLKVILDKINKMQSVVENIPSQQKNV